MIAQTTFNISIGVEKNDFDEHYGTVTLPYSDYGIEGDIVSVDGTITNISGGYFDIFSSDLSFEYDNAIEELTISASVTASASDPILVVYATITVEYEIETGFIKAEKGEISGIGDEITRENEVTADNLAMVRNYIVGYDVSVRDEIGCVCKDNLHDFHCEISERNQVIVSDGLACVYGYFGYSDSVTFDILPPAVKQYHIIYAEWNKSIIPNEFAIKIKNNQSSLNYKNAFRQDVLSSIKTGVFQMPLWLIETTSQGIEKLKDLRILDDGIGILRDGIEFVEQSEFSDKVRSYGELLGNVYAYTQEITDNSQKVATDLFVCTAIWAEINK